MWRIVWLLLGAFVVLCTACGGGAARSDNMDLLALNQPTPDATLDSVVRDLPHALAGVAPTATPTPVSVAKPLVRQAPAETKPGVQKTTAPTPKPTPPPRKPTSTPTAVARH